MNKPFKSNDYLFRPTSIGARMAELGLVSSPHLIREAKMEVIKGTKHVILSAAA